MIEKGSVKDKRRKNRTRNGSRSFRINSNYGEINENE
jgi:hypothetical protein